MSSIWGSRKRPSDEEARRSPSPDHDGANERTTLLPPEQRNGSHRLSPDDPAVSPYNLLSVRSMRYVSIVLLAVSLCWWILLLIATFITPGNPLHLRGGEFNAFAFSTLATGALGTSLLFYATPSKAERVLWSVLTGLLLVDMIIMVSAQRIRHEENWVGIVTVVWAVLVSAWALLCNRIVEYGKAEEEERLTGRVESRRSLREWCSVFSGTFFLIIFVIISALFTISLSIRARDHTLSAPGHRWQVNKGAYDVHVACQGKKLDPNGNKVVTVFIEGGEDPVEGHMREWVQKAYENRTVDRYCWWDRPGMAWSDVAPSPMSAGMAVDALSEALVKADESGPFILASHGVGGIYSRIFASRHVAEIKGLLLVNTLPSSLLNRVGSPSRGFGIWLRGFINPLGLQQLVTTIFMGHSRQDRVYGRDAYTNGKQIQAKLQENVAANTFTKQEITSAEAILPRNIPIVVVSSGKSVRSDKEWDDGQKSLTKLSDRVLAWDVVEGAGHEVWRDENGLSVLVKRLGGLVRRAQRDWDRDDVDMEEEDVLSEQ